MPVSITRLMLLTAALAGLAPLPALAFDALDRFMKVAPRLDLAKPGPLFSHIRVPMVFAPVGAGGIQIAVDIGGLGNAFGQREEFRELFGVDIVAIQEHALLGDPPNVVAYLRMDRQQAEALAQALVKRGFERTTLGTDTIYAKGEDFRSDFANRRPADPFGGQFGASQRFLIRDDLVVVTRGWPPMRVAATGLNGPRDPATGLLVDSVPAIRGAVGADAVVSQAVAYGLPSLAGATMDREAMDAIAAGRTPRLSAGATMPPFVAAWMMAGTQGKDAFAVIATLYGDEQSARQGGAAIATRLKAFDMGEGPAPVVEANAAAASGAWIGIVVARFANQPAARGALALRAWNAAVMDRRFTPLDVLR